MGVPREQEIVENARVVEQFEVLERPGDADGRDLVARKVRDVAIAGRYGSGIGVEQPRHQVEHGGLASTVGADDRQDFARGHRERHVAQGANPAETHRQAPDRKADHR